MRPLSPLRRRPLAGALLLGLGLASASLPARAEPLSAASPPASPPASWTPTVPVPPPEPPPRPDELKPQKAEGVPSAVPAPLPPERPPGLSTAPRAEEPVRTMGEAPADAPARPQPPGGDAASPEPAPPAPTHPLPSAPLPPARPPELGAAPAAQPQPDRPASPPGETAPPPASAPASAPAPTHPLATAPLPPARPSELGASPPAGPPRDVPLPPGRPSELSEKPAVGQGPSPAGPAPAPLPPARPPELSPNAPAPGQAVPMADDAACLRRLERLGVRFARGEPIVNGQCSVAAPLTVSGLGDGIALKAAETMVCPVAEALARWTFEVQLAAEKELGDTLKGLSLGGAYACRGINHGPDAQLSEHAFANAVDVMGFTFARHAPIAVGFLPAGTPEAAFLASVRLKACGFFRTVLGPGANEAHANHLHFDERDRTRGLRLCE